MKTTVKNRCNIDLVTFSTINGHASAQNRSRIRYYSHEIYAQDFSVGTINAETFDFPIELLFALGRRLKATCAFVLFLGARIPYRIFLVFSGKTR